MHIHISVKIFDYNIELDPNVSHIGYFSSEKSVQLRSYCKKELKCTSKAVILHILPAILSVNLDAQGADLNYFKMLRRFFLNCYPNYKLLYLISETEIFL